ncbi:MAG: hypothetical protein V3W19_18530, partial [Desulfatiglandales bacterium]
MRRRLPGDDAGCITPCRKRPQKIPITADDVNGHRPWPVLAGNLDVRLVVPEDDDEGVVIDI